MCVCVNVWAFVLSPGSRVFMALLKYVILSVGHEPRVTVCPFNSVNLESKGDDKDSFLAELQWGFRMCGPAAGHTRSNVQLLGCAGSRCTWHKHSVEGAKENQIPFLLTPSASPCSTGFVNQCDLSALWASQITVDKEIPSLPNLQPTGSWKSNILRELARACPTFPSEGTLRLGSLALSSWRISRGPGFGLKEKLAFGRGWGGGTLLTLLSPLAVGKSFLFPPTQHKEQRSHLSLINTGRLKKQVASLKNKSLFPLANLQIQSYFQIRR